MNQRKGYSIFTLSILLLYSAAFTSGELFFSSPEQKFWLPVVHCPSIYKFSHFHLLLQNPLDQFQPNFAQIILGCSGFEYIQIKGHIFFKGEIISKQQNTSTKLKIFFSRTTRPISTKLDWNFQVCPNNGHDFHQGELILKWQKNLLLENIGLISFNEKA